MKRDDFKLCAPKEFAIPEPANASEWAKHQFWTWYLLKPKAQNRAYDGLDRMLMMGWVIKKFAGLEDLPFVLHYWDLRMPNIVLDEKDNIIAYEAFACES